MIMDIEQIYRTGYSAGLCGHKCYPLGNHIVNDAIEELEALREELAALSAENAKLNSVVCQTCHGAGSVCSAPDDCYNCPACTATYNKIRADAIQEAIIDAGSFYCNDIDHTLTRVDDLVEYAKKIEYGS
tara:strand:- start:93 stop:482 length:390 start_codon:yes stop_codon:yes gene_type:complete